MNPTHSLRRLHEPRSNRTTNLLFAITFVVFAFVADAAMDQQQEAGTVFVDHSSVDSDPNAHHLVLVWRLTDLIPRLQF